MIFSEYCLNWIMTGELGMSDQRWLMDDGKSHLGCWYVSA